MVKYQRITLMEREDISRYIALGYSIRMIAKNLTRSSSTISREINRNVLDRNHYRAVWSQGRWNAVRRKKRKNHKLQTNIQLQEKVHELLRKKWSPEQIVKRLIILYPDNMSMRVSHETIYSYVYVLPRGRLKAELISCLRRNHKYRRKKRTHRQNYGTIQDFLSIEERPLEIADRIIPGHWEGDLICGRYNTSAIGTLVERTTRMTFLVPLINRDAHTVRKAFAETFCILPKGLKKTLTYDRGSEMAQHKLFTRDTGITVYFAHPHSPWERGTNENTNSLIRQYFPKGTNFTKISKKQLKDAQDELNDRPRKTLDWFTPHERFCNLLR